MALLPSITLAIAKLVVQLLVWFNSFTSNSSSPRWPYIIIMISSSGTGTLTGEYLYHLHYLIPNNKNSESMDDVSDELDEIIAIM